MNKKKLWTKVYKFQEEEEEEEEEEDITKDMIMKTWKTKKKGEKKKS